ncbi:MAG: sulfurtransferase [Gammaproteobacteria bacterium]|nr:sulfurtransferase [Gammaproteobacteria bacterium]
MKHNPEFLALVEDAQSRVEEINIVQLNEKLQNNDQFYLVDVREDNEWQRGRIPKAIHMSKGVIERDIEKIIVDKRATIVLYCGGGFRSALASDAIQKMGYTSVYSLQGGFGSWFSADLPVSY